MKSRSILFTSFFLVVYLFTCSGDTDIGGTDSEPPLTDIMTLELTFGAGGLEDEYLLVFPRDIAVNDAGDILIVDEDLVKVFDSQGIEKIFFGGRGEGPGEFMGASSITINEKGLITIGASNGYSIFAPDFEFTNREQIQANPRLSRLRRVGSKMFITFSPRKIYSFNESERILYISGLMFPAVEPYLATGDILVYENPDTLLQLYFFEPKNTLKIGNNYGALPFKGGFFYYILPDKRLIYIDTEADKSVNDNNWEYVLHVFSAENLTTSDVVRPYDPVFIPDSVKTKSLKDLENFNGLPTGKEIIDFMYEESDKVEHRPPVRGLKVDGNFLFVFTWHVNEKGERLAEIFDTETLSYLRSAYFPKVPRLIKDGYAYSITRNDDGFSVVEKYKIDPKVYH